VVFVFQETERLGCGRRSRCALCDTFFPNLSRQFSLPATVARAITRTRR
jgi:hypothetical protein